LIKNATLGTRISPSRENFEVINKKSNFYFFSDLMPPRSGSVIICTDPDPDPSINEQKIEKNLD
jgi:hypothetical protein